MNCVLENKQGKSSSCCGNDWCLQIPSLRIIYIFTYFSCILPRFSIQQKLSRFFFNVPPFSFSLFFLCLSLSIKTWKKHNFLVFFPHNGSFVFSEPKTKASSNVLLFYVTTEVAVTCWLLMNKYIYLASKPAYTVE